MNVFLTDITTFAEMNQAYLEVLVPTQPQESQLGVPNSLSARLSRSTVWLTSLSRDESFTRLLEPNLKASIPYRCINGL
jgi:hypothetical protein